MEGTDHCAHFVALTFLVFVEKLGGTGVFKKMIKSLLASNLLFALVACGGTGSEFDPGAGNNPGTGTSTLTINGSARAEARVTNALDPGQFSTDLSVRVEKNGIAVTTGTVTVRSATGMITLAYNPNGNGGRWEGTAAGYDEVYLFDIESGTDNVKGVRVDGPDIHTFTKPTAGATLDSTLENALEWDRGDKADSASLRTEIIDSLAIPDTGKFALAAGGLKAEKDQAKENSIRITRTNRVTPSGAAGGSEVSVSVENSVQVLVAANPAL